MSKGRQRRHDPVSRRASAGPPPEGHATTDQALTRRRLLKGALAFGAGLAVTASETHRSIPVAYGQGTVWLNVDVQKRMGSQGQRSWAIAWTSSDKPGKNRVSVGKLHLVLEAHRRQQKDCENCNQLRVDESYDGPDIVDAKARAWCEAPEVGPVEASA